MLRVCTRRLLNPAQLRALVAAVPAPSCIESGLATRHAGSLAASNEANLQSSQYPYSDPTKVIDAEWNEVEDWSFQWFDGRDKLHLEITPHGDSTDWRGVGFYSKEGYWMGSLRWTEALRGGKPAVWLHWNAKDPVELSTALPPTDHGVWKFTISFTKREFVLHCNGQLVGVRSNMLYQFKNVGRIWFADLQPLKASYMIEGDHTDDNGLTMFKDVPMYQKAKDMWKLMRDVNKEHAEERNPDHGWRSG